MNTIWLKNIFMLLLIYGLDFPLRVFKYFDNKTFLQVLGEFLFPVPAK